MNGRKISELRKEELKTIAKAKQPKKKDTDMDIDSKPAKVAQPKQALDSFGSMSSMLESMEKKIEKQMKHEFRVKQHEKARQNQTDALDVEK